MMRKQELMTALNYVAPGLSNEQGIEQGTSFIFINGKVATYNDEIATSFPIDVGFEGGVRSSELMALLNRIKDSEIEIYTDGKELRINGKKFKSGINMDEDIILPLDFLKKKIKFKKLPDGFVEGVSKCIFSASKPNQIQKLANIHIYGNIIESCDNLRATRCTINRKVSKEILLPVNAARHLIKYNFDKYSTDEDGWVHFTKDDGIVYSSRVVLSNYTDLEPFFNAKGRPIKLPKELSEILNRGEVFTEKNENIDVITVKLGGKECTIRGENEHGWFEESAKLKMAGKDKISFQVNVKILNDILKLSHKAFVSENEMKFKTEDMEHIVLLIQR